MGQNTAKRADIPRSPSTTSQVIVLKDKLEPISGVSKSPKRRFAWEKVNEITWRLESTTRYTVTPASHGQFPASRTPKALAWVICVAPGQWLARKGNEAVGPCQLHEAKAAAMDMVKGSVGDYEIDDPIAHLNQLSVRFADDDDRGGE
jgi:hypothetical protein